MAKNKDAEKYGCGCVIVAILSILALIDKLWGWTLIAGAVLIVAFFVYSRRYRQIKVDFAPEFEIKYKKSKDNETLRKITVLKMGEFLDAYCFLKNCVCTFAFSKIKECVDLSTGELVKEDLRSYYAKTRVKSFKPIEVFDFYYWEKIHYSSFLDLPNGISGFKINQKFMMDIVTFKYGERKEEFVCKRVVENKKGIERFCVELVDSSNETQYVGMSKIISVDGIEDFGEFLTQKFYESKADKDEKKQDSV